MDIPFFRDKLGWIAVPRIELHHDNRRQNCLTAGVETNGEAVLFSVLEYELTEPCG